MYSDNEAMKRRLHSVYLSNPIMLESTTCKVKGDLNLQREIETSKSKGNNCDLHPVHSADALAWCATGPFIQWNGRQTIIIIMTIIYSVPFASDPNDPV